MMNEAPRYQPLSPAAMAAAFAALALLASLSTLPMLFWMPMMGGPYYGGPGYHMGYGPHAGAGLFGFVWFIGIAALGGAIVAWVYNYVIGMRGMGVESPRPPTPTSP